MTLKLEQFSNTHDPSFVRPPGNSRLVKPTHPAKAELPMLVTVLGMVTDVRYLAPLKALPGMLVTPSGMTTVANLLHPSKMPEPALVQPTG